MEEVEDDARDADDAEHADPDCRDDKGKHFLKSESYVIFLISFAQAGFSNPKFDTQKPKITPTKVRYAGGCSRIYAHLSVIRQQMSAFYPFRGGVTQSGHCPLF